jgi:hypothetical protein
MSALHPTDRKPFLLYASDRTFRDATEAVLDIRRNYTMDAGAQISINIYDDECKMLKAGYFRNGTEYKWGGEDWIVNAVSIQQGEGNGALVNMELLERKFHLMKNNFQPQNFRAANGFSFAEKIAKKYQLKFVGEKVKGKQETIKIKSKNNKESVWSVLQRSASDNQYLCFIADKTLFFASPKYLIGRWGTKEISYKPTAKAKEEPFLFVPLVYPTPEETKDFFLVGLPNMRRALDSKKEAEGSASLVGPSARNLRAGMTVMVYGLGRAFDLAYLITSVDFDEYTAEPTEINFANIASLSPEDKAKIDKKISEVTVISGSGS